MTLRSKHTLYLALALALAAGVTACSLLVSPEKGEIKCDVSEGGRGSKDPCPGPMTCVDNVCKTIPAAREDCDDRVDNDGDDKVDEHDESVAEICDKYDNDCDGENNEGFSERFEYCDTEDNNCNGEVDEESDQDDDGFTSCGNKALQMPADCEPMQAAAHPGAKEICDGLDNDCDGNTDNAPSATESLCPDKELCLEGRCVRPSCAIEESNVKCKVNEKCVDDKCVPMNCGTPCGSAQFCDMTTTPPTCKDDPKQGKIGDPCSVDNECESRLCIDGQALSLAMPRRVCGKPCCSDAQCSASESCFASNTGARSCLPRSMISNTYPAGSKACNAINTTNDAGMPVPQCPAPQVCAVETVTQAPSGARIATSLCRTPNALSGERPVAEACANYTGCSTRLCQPIVISSVCTTPCNVTSDCAKLMEYQTIAEVHGYCQYVDYGEFSGSAGIHYGPMCVVTADARVMGSPMRECQNNAQCPDQTCIGFSALMGKAGRCAPTCCEDTQCKTLRSNARCVPVARGARRYEMRCMDQQ